MEDDSYVQLAEDGLEKALKGSGAGSALVDFLPARK